MNFDRRIAHTVTSDEFWMPILGAGMDNCPSNRKERQTRPDPFFAELDVHNTI